jgi:hypothetical protein
MRPSRFIPLLLTAALAAGSALAAPNDARSKRRFIPPPTAAEAGLRGALDAAEPLAPSPGLPGLAFPGPGPLARPLPAPGQSFTGLNAAGFSPTPAFAGLRPVGDPAPICRTECAKARLLCTSGDDLDCDPHWSQCVADCSAPALH